jgi:hypothetical protein
VLRFAIDLNARKHALHESTMQAQGDPANALVDFVNKEGMDILVLGGSQSISQISGGLGIAACSQTFGQATPPPLTSTPLHHPHPPTNQPTQPLAAATP